jgi:hypothetical protein
MVPTCAPGTVNLRKRAVNSRHSPYARRLIPLVAQAAREDTPKLLALKTGISARELLDLRESRRLPHVPTFLILARRDPALRAAVMAILSGEADASAALSLDKIVRALTS